MIFRLPTDIRAAHAMRRAINERASRSRCSEADRIHAVCEGARLMFFGSSSAAAVQLGWQSLKDAVSVPSFNPHGGHAA